jgi:hypothetical protein
MFFVGFATWLLPLPCAVATQPDEGAVFRFRHHFIDRDPGCGSLGQTALVDMDGDGDLDFITGEQGGTIWWYEFRGADDWARHVIGHDSPSDVGGAALDVDRDGHLDFVAGGAWYQNSGVPRERPFARHVFDPALAAVHDILIGDVDGDARADVVTMSDRNDVRWYTIADTPTHHWQQTHIGESVHAGISLGDIDADGDLDVVRSNIWFENDAHGSRWTPHQMTPPWGRDTPPFAVNATRTRPADINRDGRLDIVITDNENADPRIGWLEAPSDARSGQWTLHELKKGDDAIRGAFHTLQLGDFDGDGDLDIFTVEMEHIGGSRPPRWFIWENRDGRGGDFVERIILDANLGGHEAVSGDVDCDGDIDICSKIWQPKRTNANDGLNHVDFLENLAAD